MSSLRGRRFSDSRIWLPTLTSSTGGAESETRMVSPIPARAGAEGGRGLDRALECRAGLGDAQVQRPVPGFRQQLVGAHHDHRVAVLDRDLEVVETVFLEQGGFPDRRLNQRLRGCLAVLLQQLGVQGSAVDANADRGAVVLGGLGDFLDLVIELADVARVHAHRTAAGLDGGKNVLGLEVDVRDDRDLRLHRDDLQRLGVLVGGAGHPDNVAAGSRELRDLLQGRIDVMRLGGGHRLDADWRVRPDAHAADFKLTGLATGGDDRRGCSRHAEFDRSQWRPPKDLWVVLKSKYVTVCARWGTDAS